MFYNNFSVIKNKMLIFRKKGYGALPRIAVALPLSKVRCVICGKNSLCVPADTVSPPPTPGTRQSHTFGTFK